MWQKSNETDFLLTKNFILFTNQGYSLQNSSLGQLHCDGFVVSIVRSSAGRLLLESLSARRLRSSAYYPKYQNYTRKTHLINVNIFKYIFYILRKSFVSRPMVARLGTGQQRNCGPFAGRGRHSVR